ncbi:MAG: hypothetical protein JNK78_12710 [Planctomycetes bacterium]|nr:hypothetical protein [Planctomycetota bacterium]
MVRFQLGIVMCLLAGCVVQPTAPTPRVATARGPGPMALVPRIGIEHLPPDATEPQGEGPRVAPQPAPQRTAPRRRPEPKITRRDPERHSWQMTAEEIAAIDDPIARETLHFVDDLVAADQRRVRREAGLPFLALQGTDPEDGPLLSSEQALRDAQEEWAQTHGPAMLRKPFQQLLRRLPVARDVELEIQDFRSDHVPLSEPYQLTHTDPRSLGRLSVRWHASDGSDPLEVAWVFQGLRVGTSQEVGKLSLDFDLSDTLRLEIRTSTEYRTNDHSLRVDLGYRPSDGTSIHLAIGDDMDFLSTSSIYSLFETPMDGSAGLVLYAVHVF